MILFTKKRVFLIVFGYIFLVAIVAFPYWWLNVRIPTNWIIYINTEGNYSFAHPPSWIVTECRNGEIAVSRKPIKTCYLPLEAPQEYIDNVYFQIFLPKNNAIYAPYYNSQDKLPQRLNGWTSAVISRKGISQLWSTELPISLSATTSAELQEGRIYNNSAPRVGLVYHESLSEQYKAVWRSLRLLDN